MLKALPTQNGFRPVKEYDYYSHYILTIDEYNQIIDEKRAMKEEIAKLKKISHDNDDKINRITIQQTSALKQCSNCNGVLTNDQDQTELTENGL